MPFPRRLSLAGAGLAVGLAITVTGPPAFAAQAKVGLGTATSFAVLAGSTVTNTGPSTISGDVGVSPGSAVVGFPPGQVSNGTIHAADATAASAQDDLTTAYNDAAARGPAVLDETGQDLGGQTLTPGVYPASTGMSLTGTVTLDALGDPDAVFIFQAGSTLNFASSSTVALVGEAQACNVFWQVGSSATIGTGSTLVGSVLALASITMQTNASAQGRLLARSGAVTLDSNTITRPACATSPTPTPSASASPTATASPSFTSSANPTSFDTTGNPGGSDSSGGAGPGNSGGGSSTDLAGPKIPTGHPETGRDVAADHSMPWLFGGLICLAGAAVAARLGSRRPLTAPLK
jgi:hypothetical protein